MNEDAVVERLRRAHDAEAVAPLDAAALVRAGRRWRRRRAVARWGGTTAVVVLALAVGVTSWDRWSPVTEPAPPATAEALGEFETPVVVETAPFARPEGLAGPTFEEPAVDLVGRTVTLTTGGSLTCPNVPQGIRAGGSTVEVVVGHPPGTQSCTADLRVMTYVVAFPAGYEPATPPTVRVVHLAPDDDWTPPAASGAAACRPALTVCAMNRWLDEILVAGGLEPLGYEYDDVAGSEYVDVGGQHLGWRTFPLARPEGRLEMLVDRTVDHGAVVAEHGRDPSGAYPAAEFTCGGFRVVSAPSPQIPADVLAATVDAVAEAITECPADLDDLLARYPDLAAP